MDFGDPFAGDNNFLSSEETWEEGKYHIIEYVNVLLLAFLAFHLLVLRVWMSMTHGLQYWFVFVLHKLYLIETIKLGCRIMIRYKIILHLFLDQKLNTILFMYLYYTTYNTQSYTLFYSENQIYICIIVLQGMY